MMHGSPLKRFYQITNYSDKIEKNEMGRACGAYGEGEGGEGGV